MKAQAIALSAFFLVQSYAAERDVLDPLEQQLLFYQRFGGAMNPQQKAKYEELKKEYAKRELARLQKEATELSIKYQAETGQNFKFAENDLEKLKLQVAAVKKFLEEQRNKQILADVAAGKKEQDAKNAEWRAEQERNRRIRQLESDLAEAENKLRKAR